MAKRGSRSTHRALYTFDAGLDTERRGSIVASSIHDARLHARGPLSAVDGGRAATCRVEIVEVADDGSRKVVETFDSSEQLEAARAASA
jgi:hypothetical protein